MSSTREDRLRALSTLYRSVENIRYCPWKPTPKQRVFLLSKRRACLYGGAARGGKTIGQLMAALQYICVPGYRALIIRRKLSDLELPGGILDVSQQWFSGYGKWNGRTYTWTFPAGTRTSTISFGYLTTTADKYRYKGAEIQFYGLEEATEIDLADDANYPQSRLTLPKETLETHEPLEACTCHGWTLADVPLRFRLTSNPGGPGAEWVNKSYVRKAEQGEKGLYIPATVFDNPHVDAEEYVRSLEDLDWLERRRLLAGDWSVSKAGKMFDRRKFNVVPRSVVPWDELEVVRRWDMASTRKMKGKDPDYTVGVLLGRHRVYGTWWVLDVNRFRDTPAKVEQTMFETHERDDALLGTYVPVRVEQEPGSQSDMAMFKMMTSSFAGVNFTWNKPEGDKRERAKIMSNPIEKGIVNVVEDEEWNDPYFFEFDQFPDGNHDDQVDSTSAAFLDLGAGFGATVGANQPGQGYPSEAGGEATLEDYMRAAVLL